MLEHLIVSTMTWSIFRYFLVRSSFLTFLVCRLVGRINEPRREIHLFKANYSKANVFYFGKCACAIIIVSTSRKKEKKTFHKSCRRFSFSLLLITFWRTSVRTSFYQQKYKMFNSGGTNYLSFSNISNRVSELYNKFSIVQTKTLSCCD